MRARVGNWIAAPLRAVLALALVLAVAACGGSRSASGNDVVVSGSASAETFVPGATVVFTMVVQNVGNEAARDVRLTQQLGSFLVQTGFTCAAGGDAVCPAVLGPVMSVPTLGVGGILTFKISATVNVITSGTISSTMTATASDDTGRVNNAATATANVVVTATSLGVTQSAEPTVAAGSAATFQVVVANPTGATVVNNLVLQWDAATPFALEGITVTCTATGGATCPAEQPPSASMRFTVPTLGVGRSIVFNFSVPTTTSARGTIASTATVSAEGDLDAANNTSVATTLASDGRNGAYEVYAANGRLYALNIDFDARQYTFSGSGFADTRTFAPADDGGFATTLGEHLRSAEDLVVGAHAVGGSKVPYVAARRFATALGGLPATLNLMLRNVNADGSGAVTRAATARVSGNVLQVCQDDFEVVQAQSCGVGALRSFVLSISGDTYTGVDTASGKSFSFRLARSGAADVLLAVGAGTTGDATLQFLIGLNESVGLTDSVVWGPGLYADGRSEWLRTELSRTTYLAEGDIIADLSGLFRLDNTSPVAMLQGAPLPTLDGAPVWVMQSYPLVVVVGATKSDVDQPNVSGLLQIGVP
jgi:uncharacterized repeat protein (TIGR01451 family)